MANSKSNIYPIQLQGAELCLNRYDAEIKQYSGFNKNNSPFVGGCLSNVFTKEEQISGGNADNTYIDTNGDVYTVDDYGFLKNGEPIGIRSDTPLEFWDKEEFQMPEEDIICYYSEDAYASRYQDIEGFNHVVLHLGGKVLDVNTKYEYSIHKINSFYINVIIEKFHDESVGDFYCVAIKTYNNDFVIAKVYTQYGENEILEALTGLPFDQNYLTTKRFTFADPCLDYKDGNVFFAVNDASMYTIDTSDYSLFRFTATNLSKNHVNILTFADTENGKRLEYLFDGGLNTFRNNPDKKLTFYFFRKGICYLYIQPFNANPQQLYCFYDYNFNADGVTPLQHYSKKINAQENFIAPNFYDYILKKYGVEYCLSTLDSDYKEAIGIYNSTNSTNLLTNTDRHVLKISVGAVINNCILTNNGIVSGISLPGGDILATEWNSVDRDFIFFSEGFGGSEIEDNYIIYKNINNNKWYKIFRTTTKKIKFINNQIVANFNYKWNAYDIRRNKKLWYANAWNNRGTFIPENGNAIASAELLENVSYRASSYNEYNQADNSSTLFNPVPTIAPAIDVDYNTESDAEGINFYIGSITEGKIIYWRTFNSTGNYINTNLKGLPFPIDTNGNIQLSPSLFADYFSTFGNDVFIKENDNTFQLSKSNNQIILSYYFGTLIEGLQKVFILQGQYYGIINNLIFAIQFNNGIVTGMTSIVSVENLQFVGNTPYEALFFSKTNRCIYSFTGANVLNQKQLVDKISEVKNYLYNPATQTVFLITDIGIIFYGLFGIFLLEYTNITKIFLLDNGIVLSDNLGNYRYIKYYLDEGDEGYTKENIKIETCFYGMNNETVTINDCLYFRLFSEEHEEGDLKVSATTISLSGRKTEETTFKIKASDWDKITHTIYMRYQPKTQRGLGVSFSIDSPFKIASLSVGSQPDAVLVDKVSKGAINAPSVTSNNDEW